MNDYMVEAAELKFLQEYFAKQLMTAERKAEECNNYPLFQKDIEDTKKAITISTRLIQFSANLMCVSSSLAMALNDRKENNEQL